MKKNFKQWMKVGFTTVLCGSVLLPLARMGFDSTSVVAMEEIADVWSTYSTYGVMQNPEEQKKNAYQPKVMEAELSISMAKGETEGGQILFTAKRDIFSFDFKVSDLTNQDNVISAENIKVYKQSYTYVSDARTKMTIGWYPDMLLPIELAKKAKETKVEAGMNQGITVEVTTTSETIPGTYTGSFELELDGVKKEIPVTLTVWDIDITESHSYTVDVGMYDKMSMGGDASAESIRKYYDQMLDYRANILYMPFSTYNVDRFIEELLKYWNHPRVTYIGIPEEFTVFGQYVLEAARHSTPDMILTDKLYAYDKANDEETDPKKVLNSMTQFNAQLQKTIDTLVAENFFVAYDGVAQGGAFYKRLSESIKNVSIIETIGWREEYRDLNITYVPHNQFGSGSTLPGEGGVYYEANRDVYDDQSSNGTYLHYINGTGPWLGHSLPNYTSGLRYWGYNMQAEGMQGELSWSVSEYAYVQQGQSFTYLPRNYYESAMSFSSLGLCLDGQYLYPGGRYGVTGFIPSLRLAVRRDGLEDYELIYKLEELYKEELMQDYGVNYDTRDVLDWVYRKAVADTNYYHSDDSLVFEMRQNIVDLIFLAESEAKFMLDGITLDGDEANVVFHTANGWDVTFCGTPLTGTTEGTGTRYSIQRNVNTGNDISIRLKKDDFEYVFNAKMVRNTVYVRELNGTDLPNGFLYRNDATATAGTNGIAVSYEKYLLDDPEDIIFKQDRYFGLNEDFFDCSIHDLYDITLTFEIETENVDDDFLLTMYACVGDYSIGYLLDAKTVYSNGSNKRTVTTTFLVDELDKKLFAQYEKIDQMIWRFQNAKKENGEYRFYEDMKVTLKEVSYTKDGRMGE